MSSTPLLEVSGLVKRFDRGKVRVLDGIDLQVDRGELLTITGASGSGKSTLLHLIAALDRPDSGRILVDGRDLARRRDLNHFRRSELGLVFQLHNLIPRLTAVENVEIAMFGTGTSRAKRRERARELLHELGLDPVAHREPARLSGGERQRVAIARALANRPKLLLADEPTGSLDRDAAEIVLELFERLRADHGTTIVLVTHDPRLALAATRRVRLVGGALAPAAEASPSSSIDGRRS